MSWLIVLAPLFIAGLIFLAYLGGKKAGRKEAELERIKKEMEQSENVDAIIGNNYNMSADDIDAWLQSHRKK